MRRRASRRAACPPRLRGGGAWSRGGRDLPGWGRSSRPLFGGHARRVHRRPRPVDAAKLSEPIEQYLPQASPHAGLLPVAQPTPAGHAAAPELLREHPPRDTTPQDVDDAGERRPGGQAGPSSPGGAGSDGSRGSTARHNSSMTKYRQAEYEPPLHPVDAAHAIRPASAQPPSRRSGAA